MAPPGFISVDQKFIIKPLKNNSHNWGEAGLLMVCLFCRCGKNILMFMGLGGQTEADKSRRDLI